MPQVMHAVKKPIHAKVTIPGSKSVTRRALLLASLADGVSELSGIFINEDIRVYIKALHTLGIVMQLDEKSRSCIVAGGNGKFPKTQATVWCANAKSVARFLLAACATTPGVYYFDGDKPLRHKPITHLLNVLCRQGAQIIPNDTRKMPFTLVGSDSLEGGEIILDNKITSQLISALLIIAPFSRSPFTFNVTDLANQPYIDMTCAMMAEYGVLVHRVHKGQFMVPVPQRYQAKDFIIEPDFSLAAYFFAAAAVTGGEISIQPVKHRQSKQPNAKFISVLEKMGCHVHESASGLKLKGPTELQGIDVNMRDFSDTFLALAAIAPFAKSPVRITHIGALNQKEKTRLAAIKAELLKLGTRFESGDDWIKIFPSAPIGCLVNSQKDPRLAMALAIIGLKIPGVEIENAECVNKVFPGFFTVWDKLGEKVPA